MRVQFDKRWEKNYDFTDRQTERTGYPSIDRPWLKYYSEEALNAVLPECTIYEYLWEKNKEHLDDVALNYYDRKITFKDLFEQIENVAKSFINIGVRENDIVTLAVLACPETVICLYALNKIGAVSNMINVLSSADEYVDYINEVESKVFVCWKTFYNVASDKFAETGVKKIVIIDPGNYLPFYKKIAYILKDKERMEYTDKIISWKDFVSLGKKALIVENSFSAGQPCVIAHTGGTTGEPKSVVLSNKSLNSVAMQYELTFSYKRGETLMDLIVPFVIYGIGTNIHMPLSLGLTVILIPFFKPEEIPGFFVHYKPNVVASIPAYWTPLLLDKKIKRDKTDFSELRLAAAGGDGMTVEIEDVMNTFFKTHNSKAVMINGYGMTELCSAAITNFSFAVRRGSIGIPMPVNIVKIVEPETEKELKYNEIGEICICSPCPMIGYYKNREATNELIRIHSDGLRWVHSGDLGYVDEDGFVFITGRMKRIILTSYTEIPSKIFPDRIEKVIMQHPDVFQCCVVSDPHPQYRFVTKAHIVLRKRNEKDKKEIEKEVRQICMDNLPEYSVPFSYYFRESLPLTAVGKVDWMALEKECQ